MPPVRHDLLALTPAALAALSNQGLLKRALRECEEGRGPGLETGEDGTVTARFADGVEVRLVPGRALKDCPCTCGAVGACRHRVGAILGYQRSGAAAARREELLAPWSPAEVDDAALERLLGKAALARASALRRRGVLVEVTRGDFEGDRLPRAQLATATVRFLVPRDPSHARCDCRARTGCEHVALAVWAFRLAAQRDPAALVLTVEVADPTAPDTRRESGLQAAREAAGLVLLEGASRLPPAAGARFALARMALEQARMAWLADAVDDLQALVEAYGRRSARYSPGRLADTLVDLLARARAAEGHGALPAAAVLGSDEAPQAELDQLRLCALGARVEADGDQRLVEVLFAGPASQSVLVVRRSLGPSDGGDDGPNLARRAGLAGASLGQLATCQLVSNAAVRRPNRQVSFRTGPLRKTSVLPGGAELDVVPQSLRVREVPGFERQLTAQAPRMLRPRLVAEDVRVISLARVEAMTYDAGQQALRATCFAEDGQAPFVLEGHHRAVAPGALPALARLLGSGAVRAVVGGVRKHGARLVVDPIALWTDRIEVLDFQEGSIEALQLLAGLPNHREEAVEDPILGQLGRVHSLLAEAAHQGLRNVGPPWRGRLKEAGARLGAQGLSRVHAVLERFDDALSTAQSTGSEVDELRLVGCWASAAIRVELAVTGAEESAEEPGTR